MNIFKFLKRKTQKKHSHPLYVVYQEEINGKYTLVEHHILSKQEYLNLKREEHVVILGEFDTKDLALERLHLLYNTANYKDYTYDYDYDYSKLLTLN